MPRKDETAHHATEEVDDALAAFGLVAEESLEVEDTFALWPENVATFVLWQGVQTQWQRAPMGGLCGLNYQGVQVCMQMQGIKKRDRQRVFNEIQAMEVAFLNVINEK